MATHLRPFVAVSFFFLFFSNSPIDAISSLLPDPSLRQQEPMSSDSPPPTQNVPLLLHAQLAPILGTLGFQELAMAVPSISESSFASLNGPATLFAPSDESMHTCPYCSASGILKEHIVPGIFSSPYLTKLVPVVKLQTMSPGRCITLTTSKENSSKIFINGVEIIHPDLYNDGLLVIHGLQGYVTPLSPNSCNPTSPEKNLSPQGSTGNDNPFSPQPSTIMRLMLSDAMLRLREIGYGILALSLRAKYVELVNLQNMTIFALEDSTIFSGGHAYVNSMRYHIVPNRYFMRIDLMRLPVGTSMKTLIDGESLVVTDNRLSGGAVRINYVPLKTADVLYNLKIVVHSIFWPFPHLNSSTFVSATDEGKSRTPSAESVHQNCAVDSPGNQECNQASVRAEDDGF